MPSNSVIVFSVAIIDAIGNIYLRILNCLIVQRQISCLSLLYHRHKMQKILHKKPKNNLQMTQDNFLS